MCSLATECVLIFVLKGGLRCPASVCFGHYFYFEGDFPFKKNIEGDFPFKKT